METRHGQLPALNTTSAAAHLPVVLACCTKVVEHALTGRRSWHVGGLLSGLEVL